MTEKTNDKPNSYCCDVEIYSQGKFRYFCSKCNRPQMIWLVFYYEALENEKEIERKEKVKN